jgi:hypothetical protein
MNCGRAIFIRQHFKHSRTDIELDGQAKAAAGANALGPTDASSGNSKYDSRAIAALRDAKLDPRAHRPHPSSRSEPRELGPPLPSSAAARAIVWQYASHVCDRRHAIPLHFS